MRHWDESGPGPAGLFTRRAGEDRGRREVVCVHGLGASSRYFLPLADALRDDTRVTAMDLPGFGRTRGPRKPLDVRGLSLSLAEWMRARPAASADKPVLVANSLGCQIVVDLAVHAPDLLGPTVLIGPTMDADARSVVQQAWRLAQDLTHERPAIIPLLAVDYARCGPRRYLATLRAGLRDPVERKLHRLPVPALVVRGALDPIAPRDWASRLAEGLPRGRYTEVAGVGHAVNYSSAPPLAQLVRELL